MRTVIVHYHIFKNAGTSLDAALLGSLGSGWVNHEVTPFIRPEALGEFIVAHPEALAVSSHTALLPPPDIADTLVIPVIFVRHPIDRARSTYDFERFQVPDTETSLVAKQLEIGRYMEWRLGRANGTDTALRSYQAIRLAPAGHGSSLLERALDATSKLPFVGLVEAYGESIGRLEDLLAPHVPGIHLQSNRENYTPGAPRTLGDRLAGFRRAVGEELYLRLLDANADDLAIWEHVRRRYPMPDDALGYRVQTAGGRLDWLAGWVRPQLSRRGAAIFHRRSHTR